MLTLNCILILITVSKLSDSELIRHTFVIEYFSGSPDGVYKQKILGINGQFPGPVIEAQIGDTLQVDVINRIQDKQNTSIHWHGIHQAGTPWEDGPAYITQCPLAYSQTQRYSFQLKQAGTFWYHSHIRSQRTEGLWGVFIVHNNPEQYSYDGSIIIALNDWYHHTMRENEQWQLHPDRGIFPYPDSGLINGVGRYDCGFAIHPCNVSYQMRPVFKVQREKTYRVHVINAAALVAYNFSIDGHPLQVIETDSIDVKNGMLYDVASVAAGQRYSFLITTKEEKTTRFLIRAEMRKEYLLIPLVEEKNNNMYPEVVIGDVTAVLEYSEKDSVGLEPYSYLDPVPQKEKMLIPVDEMELEPWDGVYAPRRYDVEVVLMMDFLIYEDGIRRAAFNETPFLLPDRVKPMLMSVVDGEDVNDDILHIEVDYMQVVQLVVNNPNRGPHPLHLHGHDFWVLGKGNWNDGNFDDIRHNETLRLTGPKRDTVIVEQRSWVVIRFIADNPGVWPFHCHIDWHMLTGMTAVFVVGRKELQNIKVNEEAYNICKQHNIYSTDNETDNKSDSNVEIPNSSSSSDESVIISAVVVFLCISFLSM